MANIGKWIAGQTIATILSTDLNTLTNGSLSTPTEGGATYDNATNLNLYADFELVLASLAPTGNPSCTLYFLPALDGTNYADAAAAMTNHILAVFPVTTGSGAKRSIVRNVLLPPLKGKFALLNNTGVSFAGSANTVKLTTWNINLNG